MKVVMKLKKETKGTVVYINDDEGAALTQVYVQKSALTAPYPEEITITIKYSK